MLRRKINVLYLRVIYRDVFRCILCVMNRSNDALILSRVFIRDVKYRQLTRNQEIIAVELFPKLLSAYFAVALQLKKKHMCEMS